MDDAPQICDLKGLNCPLPVLRTRKRLAAMPAGARLLVETTDPLAVIDIPAFCNEDGHLLVSDQAMGGYHQFLIEKSQR